MGEDTKKPDPQSTTTPSSQEQSKKKEETTQAGPPDPAAETAAQKQDETDILQTLLQQTSTPPPSKDSKVKSNASAASPHNPPNNDPTAAPPPDPPQPPKDAAKQGENQGKSWVDRVKDSVTILGGSTAVVIALFVFVGRRYAEGYFNALNVPVFSVNFPVWDYGERGLVNLFQFAISKQTLVFIKFFVFVNIIVIILKEISKRTKRVSISSENLASCISIFVQILQSIATVSFVIAILGVIIYLISDMSVAAYEEGREGGYQYIQERAMGVRLTSKEPFLMPAPTVTAVTATANDEPMYTYEGLYLLTDNDGTYFLFDDIDETCSPTNVYIVQETQLLSVEFIPETFSKNCTPPTPTPIRQVSTPILPTPTVTPTTAPTPTPTPQATPTSMP